MNNNTCSLVRQPFIRDSEHWQNIITDMKNTNQSPNQSVLMHCRSVTHYAKVLISHLHSSVYPDGWSIPDWLKTNARGIYKHLYSIEDIELYTFWHDMGKPYCLENGRFVNHAAISEMLWLQLGGEAKIGKLIGMDMDIHQLKYTGVKEFASRPEAITLLIVGLAEVHANAELFGGIDSLSFKIKYRQIEKQGKQICAELGLLI